MMQSAVYLLVVLSFLQRLDAVPAPGSSLKLSTTTIGIQSASTPAWSPVLDDKTSRDVTGPDSGAPTDVEKDTLPISYTGDLVINTTEELIITNLTPLDPGYYDQFKYLKFRPVGTRLNSTRLARRERSNIMARQSIIVNLPAADAAWWAEYMQQPFYKIGRQFYNVARSVFAQFGKDPPFPPPFSRFISSKLEPWPNYPKANDFLQRGFKAKLMSDPDWYPRTSADWAQFVRSSKFWIGMWDWDQNEQLLGPPSVEEFNEAFSKVMDWDDGEPLGPMEDLGVEELGEPYWEWASRAHPKLLEDAYAHGREISAMVEQKLGEPVDAATRSLFHGYSWEDLNAFKDSAINDWWEPATAEAEGDDIFKHSLDWFRNDDNFRSPNQFGGDGAPPEPDQIPEDQNPEDQDPNDQDPKDQNPEDQDPDDQDPKDQNPEDQNPEDQNPEDQNPEEPKPGEPKPGEPKPGEPNPEEPRPNLPDTKADPEDWLGKLNGEDWESMSDASRMTALNELSSAGVDLEPLNTGQVSFSALSEGVNFEIPGELLNSMTYATTDGLLYGAGGELLSGEAGMLAGVEGGAGVLEAGVASVEAEAVAEGSMATAEGGLVGAGPETLGLTIAVAVVMAAAQFAVIPLIHALKDDRQTKVLRGFMFDIDGDGQPEYIENLKSKLTPNNPFQYVKQGKMDKFWAHFHKKDSFEFDEVDGVWGKVHYKWRGDVWANQRQVLYIVQDMSMTDTQKLMAILDVFEAPALNPKHNEKHDHVWIDIDIDHDGHTEKIDIDYHGNGKYKHGKLKIKGDVDGNNNLDKCEWSDGRIDKECKESDSPSESDKND